MPAEPASAAKTGIDSRTRLVVVALLVVAAAQSSPRRGSARAHEVGDEALWRGDARRSAAKPRGVRGIEPAARAQRVRAPGVHGEGRNRTGDTTVFSRVLYQLSYLAERPQCSRTVVKSYEAPSRTPSSRPSRTMSSQTAALRSNSSLAS